MDLASRDAIRLLEAIAAANSRLMELAALVRPHPNVVNVQRSLQCWQYQPRPVLEGWVDATLASGKGIAWVITVTWDDEVWTISPKVVMNVDNGQDTLVELKEQTADNFSSMIEGLTYAMSELISSFGAVDLGG